MIPVQKKGIGQNDCVFSSPLSYDFSRILNLEVFAPNLKLGAFTPNLKLGVFTPNLNPGVFAPNFPFPARNLEQRGNVRLLVVFLIQECLHLISN